ncbi:two-component system, chemotaxis family, response regulator CheY [Colwellia chukchiensis]|uniref:Two-component system, chemotaxis family, response regulator CheY n=1 Tax=Colwellia chukchiensis TaxID=641665 RepID=A0A1H7GKU7_9GAMM|nr:response regulator [Colwellia chukchiensis]SEK38167.1 two-component system, chemotaxis family, response regulator CheY [Colwellia chukchiensis]
MNILVVDDKAIVIDKLSGLLSASGYAVASAINGLDASEKLQQADYDLLIVDHLMPIMDGIQLVKNLRQNEKYNHTPIIFMTTQGQDSVKQLCNIDMFTAVIDKPIDEQKLLDLVTSLESANSRYQSL